MRRCELALLGLLACGSPPEAPDTGPEEVFDCELGALTADGGFVSFAEHDQAELVLGFQGLLMVLTRVRAVDPPSGCHAVGSITPEADEPSGTNQPYLPFDGDGLSEELVLYLPSNVPSAYEGTVADVAVRVEGGRASCVATATVTLVDEDPCIGAVGGCTETSP